MLVAYIYSIQGRRSFVLAKEIEITNFSSILVDEELPTVPWVVDESLSVLEEVADVLEDDQLLAVPWVVDESLPVLEEVADVLEDDQLLAVPWVVDESLPVLEEVADVLEDDRLLAVPWVVDESLSGSEEEADVPEDDPPLPHHPQKWNNYPAPKRISGFLAIGKGPTNGTSYSGLQAFFAPEYPLYTVLPLVEATGLYFFDGTYGINLGAGGRYLSPKLPVIIGFNATGGYYQAKLGPLFQLGLGAEVIGQRWGVYANGYIPVGRKRQVAKRVFDEYGDGFKASYKRTQSSYGGFNVEGESFGFPKKGLFPLCIGRALFLFFSSILLPFFFLRRSIHHPTSVR